MLVELSYLLLSILIFTYIYNYIKIIINKSSLENEEETYIRLIYNKLLYFKFLTDNEMNMKTITNEYLELQKQLHLNPDYGIASLSFAPIVAEIIKKANIKSL